jgi:hypothetical protein
VLWGFAKSECKTTTCLTHWATHGTTKRMLEFEIVAHGGSGCSAALSHVPPLYIPVWDGRMTMYLASLEEVYSLTLVLRFCHYSYRPPALLLGFILCSVYTVQWVRPVSKSWPWLAWNWPILRRDNLMWSPWLYIQFSRLDWWSPVCIIFESPFVNSIMCSEAVSSHCMYPSLSPVAIGHCSVLGLINITESVSQ